MESLNCNCDGGFDRVVIDIPTQAEVGGLCESCLDTRFTPVFQDNIWQEDSGCAVCAKEPQYQLPPINCIIQFSDLRADIVEYGITDSTVRLCTEHLQEILALPSEDFQATETISPRS